MQLAQNLPILKMVMAAFALVNNDNNNNNHLGISRVTKTNAYFLLTVHYMWRPSGFLLFTQGPSESDPVPFWEAAVLTFSSELPEAAPTSEPCWHTIRPDQLTFRLTARLSWEI